MEGKSKNKEESIRESQERYQAFLRNSQEGIWRIELDEPIPISLSPKKQIKLMYKHAWLAEANQAMAKMYGFKSAKQIVGARLGDLLIESDENNIAYLMAFIENSYKLSGVESHEKDRHGQDKYFRNSLVGIVENGLLLRAWGTQQDVTEQHIAYETSIKNEHRLKLALRATNMGIWEWNIETKELHWSDELKKIFGLPNSYEITYEKFIKLIHPEDLEKMNKVITNAILNGESYWVEHRTIYPDGSLHWILGQGKAFKENGKVTYMMGTSMLIDDRKQIEAQILESEARFRTMADTAPVMIWIADIEGKITYVNRLFITYSGLELGENSEIDWQKVIHPDDLEYVVNSVIGAIKHKRDYSLEFRMLRADGRFRYVLTKAIPRISPDGEFLGYIGTTIDIEDIKNATRRSAELELTNAELVSLNDAKDEFISIASHQLRTPATGVKQYIGMVLEGFAGMINKDQMEMLKLAYDSNERQINIVNDLLRVAQIDSGKVVPQKKKSDIVAIIKDVIKEQQNKFKAREQKIAFASPNSCIVSVDSRLVRMVIENLLDNAGKYSPVKSEIKVKVKVLAHEVVISVQDQGIGIDTKDQAKLFQKFQRIQNHLTSGIEGSGLGLYWSKSIIDLHGGRISVKSKLNQGSTFSIHLPLKKQEQNKP